MMAKNWLVAVITVYGLLVFSQLTYSESLSKPTFGVTTMWESKYVSQGRDNLDDGGIFSFEGTADWYGMTVGTWFATGDSEYYDELNFYIEYGLEFSLLDAYVGYTRLEYLKDNASDNEGYGGIAINNIPYVVPSLDYIYSTGASGGFLEFSFRSKVVLLDKQLTLEPYILEGFDFGYASEEYDGPNNLQVGIDFTFVLTNHFSIISSVAYSWAHEDVKKDNLGDVSWGKIGLSAEF